MRGLPGSGKTYRARELLDEYGVDETHLLSTDKFFSQNDSLEEYRRNWKPHKLEEAHNWTWRNFHEAVGRGKTPIILDNTNVLIQYFNKYVEFALTFDEISDLEDVKNFRDNKVNYGKDRDGEYYFERNFPIDGDRDFNVSDNAFEKFIKDAVRDGILDKIKFRFECRLPHEIRISNSDYVRGSKTAKWRFTLGDIIDKKEFTMWCKLR